MSLGRLCTALLLLAACRPALEDSKAAPPQVALSGVRMRFFKDATLVAQGSAERLVYDRSSSGFSAVNSKLKLSARGGSQLREQELSITAPLASGHLPSRQVEGKAGVNVHSASGLLGNTPEVFFDGQTGIAQGKQPVELSGPGYSVSAQGFSLDTREEHFTFEGQVQSRFGGTP